MDHMDHCPARKKTALQQTPLRALLVARPRLDARRFLHRADQRGEFGVVAVDDLGQSDDLERGKAAELGFDQRMAVRFSQDLLEPISRGHAVDERPLFR